VTRRTEALGAVEGAGEAMAAAVKTLVICLPIPSPLLTLNVRMHWRVRARHVKAQRHDAMMAAYVAMCPDVETLRAVPFPAGKVRADVTVYRRPHQRVPDEGAQWEWLKPVWDGFQDASVVQDDKQIIHGTIRYLPTDPDPRVEVTLTAVAD
jgi:hypothetical protein